MRYVLGPLFSPPRKTTMSNPRRSSFRIVRRTVRTHTPARRAISLWPVRASPFRESRKIISQTANSLRESSRITASTNPLIIGQRTLLVFWDWRDSLILAAACVLEATGRPRYLLFLDMTTRASHCKRSGSVQWSPPIRGMRVHRTASLIAVLRRDRAYSCGVEHSAFACDRRLVQRG